MAELKPTATVSASKNTFVNKTGSAPAKTPGTKIRPLSSPGDRYFKALLFGDYGSGKTFALIGLLLEGLVVLVIGTDIGGDGLASVVAELNRIGRPELKDNLVFINLPTQEDVTAFFKDPNDYWEPGVRGAETIWDAGIDVAFWDGFTGYQQVQLADYIEYNDDSIVNKDGTIDTQRYWGAIRRETARALNKFLALNNRKTGKAWHKFMTCLDSATMTESQALKAASESDQKERQNIGKVKEAIGPFVQGSAAKLLGPAFDLIIYTHAKTVLEDGKQVTKYTYQTAKSDKMKVKARGIDLSALTIDPKKLTLKADMGEVWRQAVKQLDLARPAQGEQAA